MKHILVIALIAIAFTACKKDEQPVEPTNQSLVGSWLMAESQDTLLHFVKTDNLAENQYGITFMSNNSLIERKNNSFCGTPPITTADYNGTWSYTDSLITISVGYWGGTAQYSWKILSQTSNHLTIDVVESKFLE